MKKKQEKMEESMNYILELLKKNSVTTKFVGEDIVIDGIADVISREYNSLEAPK